MYMKLVNSTIRKCNDNDNDNENNFIKHKDSL